MTLIPFCNLFTYTITNDNVECSRTLTAVHDAILEDIVYPNEITGKRIRYRPDASRLIRVFLHQEGHCEDKVCFIIIVTGKNIPFIIITCSCYHFNGVAKFDLMLIFRINNSVLFWLQMLTLVSL